MKELCLFIVTPTGVIPPVTCESVRFSVKDDGKGKGGGRYGVRPGHAAALLAVAHGKVEALTKGETVFSHYCGDGFATIEENQVTLVVDCCKEDR